MMKATPPTKLARANSTVDLKKKLKRRFAHQELSLWHYVNAIVSSFFTWILVGGHVLVLSIIAATLLLSLVAYSVRQLDFDSFLDEGTRIVLTSSSGPLLVFLTTGLISSSNSTNGSIRTAVASLIGKSSMLLSLSVTLSESENLRDQICAYIFTLTRAARSPIPGRGGAHQASMKQFKVALAAVEGWMSTRDGDRKNLGPMSSTQYEAIQRALVETQASYGALLAARNSKPPAAVTFGYWMSTFVATASATLVASDQSTGEAVAAAVLANAPSAALYLSSVSDPLYLLSSNLRKRDMVDDLKALENKALDNLRLDADLVDLLKTATEKEVDGAKPTDAAPASSCSFNLSNLELAPLVQSRAS